MKTEKECRQELKILKLDKQIEEKIIIPDSFVVKNVDNSCKSIKDEILNDFDEMWNNTKPVNIGDNKIE